MARRRLGDPPDRHRSVSEAYFRDASIAADGAREMSRMGQCDQALKYLRKAEFDRGSGYSHMESSRSEAERSLRETHASRNAMALTREAFSAFKRRCLVRS